MSTYKISVTLKTQDPIDANVVADYVRDAVSHWGGQFEPNDPLFSGNIAVKTACRGNTVEDDDFSKFLEEGTC